MSLSISFPPVVALLCFLIYRYIIYPVLLSPLNSIPAAYPTASFTSLWITYCRRNGSQALPTISKAHTLHGPIVRLSPNELSVCSAEAIHKVYVEKGGFAKPQWWAQLFQSYGLRNMVSMQGGIGSKEHAARKRDLGNMYAKSVLLVSEDLKAVAAQISRDLGDVLREIANGEKKGVMKVYNFSGAVSADFASAYLFGDQGRTNFLNDVAKRNEYFGHHGTWLKRKPGQAKSQEWLEGFGRQCCSAAELAARDKEKGSSSAIVHQQLFSRELRGDEIASETLDHFIAGSEAPRTTLMYLQRELSRHPALQTCLRTELQTLDLDLETGIPDLKSLDTLSLLDAVLTETLRLYAPSPGPQHRIVPQEGVTLHGCFIPGGTEISATFRVLHYNAEVFSHPGEWRPERWLGEDIEVQTEMKRWFWSFGKGSRVCIGKDFAMIVMKLIVAKIYASYETEIVEDKGMEQEDQILAGPVGERLMLRFKMVQ